MAKDKRDKKKKKGDDGTPQTVKPSVANHPRARVSVRRWKGRAGLVGLFLGGLLGHGAGLTAFDATARALEVGIMCYFVAWIAALTVWRALIPAEMTLRLEAQEKAAGERREKARLALAAAAARGDL